MTQTFYSLHRRLLLVTVIFATLVAPQLGAATLAQTVSPKDSPKQEIRAIMGEWIDAVAGKKTDDLTLLVDSESEAYYLRIKEMALNADAAELVDLAEVELLQLMFFRLMMDREQLQGLTAAQLLAFAVEKGFIGMELRRADSLEEIELDDNTAKGRLYKFGKEDRADRYQQYFVKEQGSWRVSLRGEQERLEGEFDSFVQRSGLSRSEAAFLILEMRTMRKVTRADFIGYDEVAEEGVTATAVLSFGAMEQFRLVSVRLSETLVGTSAVTLDDTHTGLKYVLQRGDSVPGYPDITLQRIEPSAAKFENQLDSRESLSLSLDPDDRLSRREVVAEGGSQVHNTLVDEATLGERYPGEMMVQWRNIGLRGRAQLLQQAWLTPDFGRALGPDKKMLGLKVSQVTAASFWDQAGLQDGDLLKELNGFPINTLDAWKKAIRVAETEQELTVKLERGDHELIFRTHTVKPG
ncbi:MAG: hypothetical protein V7754_01105 [Halioglobus sp.]